MAPWPFGCWPRRDGGKYEREGEDAKAQRSSFRGEGGINPIVRTYMYPGDDRSCCRYVLVLCLLVGGILPFLGPAVGIFVADPIIQLALVLAPIITPKSDCFDTKVSSQVCDGGDIHWDYYFFNITNADKWKAGLEPPAYQEVGPYAFLFKEVRYNVSFANEWEEVSYTYHQWNEFQPDLSCLGCSLEDSIVGVNRGYLQFMSASKAASAGKLTPEPPEEAMAMQLLPITMSVLFGSAAAAMRAGIEGQYAAAGAPLPDEATLAGMAQGAAVQQWTDCGPLLAVDPSKPYLTDVAPQIPFAPELCAYIPAAVLQQYGAVITPAQFLAVGVSIGESLNLPYAAAAAFLTAAIGASNSTYLDPAAAQFLGAFLTLPRAGTLSALGTTTPGLAAALSPLSDLQWGLLQGYLMSLGPTWSHAVYEGYLATKPPPAPEKADPEAMVIYGLMPTVLHTIWTSILGAITPGVAAQYAQYGITDPASIAATAAQTTLEQFTNCSPLLALDPTKPYLQDLAPQFPFAPELCAYIPTVSQQLFGLTVTPSQLAAMGADLPLPSVQAFLQAGMGATNATWQDPAAAQFMAGFLTNNRTATLALLTAAAPPLAAALSPLTDLHWNLLKGYVGSLVPTWGTLVFASWLNGGGGGLVVTKTVDQWLYGYEDPVLLAAAQAASPQLYRLMPWTYTPSLAKAFPSRDFITDYFSSLTGVNVTFDMLSWRSTDLGRFHPLIQQKELETGKGRDSTPQDVTRYRGIPFTNMTHGIINVTGINEGVAFGPAFRSSEEPLQYESGFSRTIKAKYTGNKFEVKGVETFQFEMHPDSRAACNLTEYGLWALATAFDPDAYHDAINTIPPEQYWALMTNDIALGAHLAGTPLKDLGRYFGTPDTRRERCMTPDALDGMWDVSNTFISPTVVTFPHFHQADPFLTYTTGNASAWTPDAIYHGWFYAIEPFTGFSIQGHKTGQVSALVTNSTHLYPDLWIVPGSGAAIGMPEDFVTVPSYWWNNWWEPTDKSAKLFAGLVKANDALYFLLVSTFPAVGWLLQGIALIMLFATKTARARKRELKKLQKSQAKRTKLGRREVVLMDALVRAARGSRVLIPADLDENGSDTSDDEAEAAAEGKDTAKATAGKKDRLGGYVRKVAAKVSAAVSAGEAKPTAPREEEIQEGGIEAYLPPGRLGRDEEEGGGAGEAPAAGLLPPQGVAPSHSDLWQGVQTAAGAARAGSGQGEGRGSGLRRRTTSTSG